MAPRTNGCSRACRSRERGAQHVLTTLLCMARVPRAEVFLVFLKETAEAATESPAALERKVREKAKENSLAVWRGMAPRWRWRGVGAASERRCGPSYARRGCGCLAWRLGNLRGKWFDAGSGRAWESASELGAAGGWRCFELVPLGLQIRPKFRFCRRTPQRRLERSAGSMACACGGPTAGRLLITSRPGTLTPMEDSMTNILHIHPIGFRHQAPLLRLRPSCEYRVSSGEDHRRARHHPLSYLI